MGNRKSGVLLHVTSLPGIEGIGTLGEEAYKFVDFLKSTGQKIWQILPLGPVGVGNSPYQCFSAFAGNPLLIDLGFLLQEELIGNELLEEAPGFTKTKVQFEKVSQWKQEVLFEAFQCFRNLLFERYRDEYFHFLNEHGWWLNDYALFISVREQMRGTHWSKWDDSLKFRDPGAIQKISEKLKLEIDFQKFLQFIFFRQWHRLKNYANQSGIEIVGDVPLYVSGDSSDVWTNTDIFFLDEKLDPIEVGGVPPDYFSDSGQLWGNPVFNWQKLKERNYDWWMARLHFNVNMFNQVRIDHFRGLESFWSVPAKQDTAINGKWVPAYGYEMLALIQSQIGNLPFIAEDLGIITPEVNQLRKTFNLPGMKVLQFAFTTDSTNTDLPHNYGKNAVVFTGTHDNDTSLGWLQSVSGEEKKTAERYLGIPLESKLRDLLELAYGSVADTVIIPMQDILELDSKARMNIPGTVVGNWNWRFQWKQLKTEQKRFLREVTEKYNRRII